MRLLQTNLSRQTQYHKLAAIKGIKGLSFSSQKEGHHWVVLDDKVNI